ncbi:hypothetical protein [Kitasatospora sp. NPDC001175]|uniref:hypothetical protein n=1 Tax=Kitasatospora sp. NPDC001175 TaxID=3157103 RepID=UPI003CFC6C1A
MSNRSTGRGRALMGRGHGRRRTVSVLLALAALTGAAGCSENQDDASHLGQVPIPSAPASPIVPTASQGHAQLVAMGDAVALDLGTGQGRITATGPDLDLPAPSPGSAPPERSKGTITVRLHATAGSVDLDPATFALTDELGHAVPFTADRPSATANPAQDAVFTLSAVFDAGHSTLSWSSAGKPLATWDFEVELD